MNQSGTKLVVALGMLALAFGVGSWWYRFESAHRTTQFWGPEGAELIVEPGQVIAFRLQPLIGEESEEEKLLPQLSGEYAVDSRFDLTKAPGLVHLRHALTSDSNYIWEESAPAPSTWRWALQFGDADQPLLVLLTDDLATIGKLAGGSSSLAVISCRPMAETLQQYFQELGLSKEK